MSVDIIIYGIIFTLAFFMIRPIVKKVIKVESYSIKNIDNEEI